ncbi:MAG: rane protein insertase, YidC/Oxa1 family [Frankiales bacterium]|nr:rane protein insertase, YidC/Oxa1 family [Frankiales bacterium]
MFDVLAGPVGLVLRTIHSLLTNAGLPSGSGLAWGLSIVLLTMTVRLLLFPLFVKQIKSQRRMQEIAPKVKELQKLHKGDRETLNTEMMKLYKDHGANPISGCLPLVLQLPVFFALFKVMREFKPGAEAKYHLSERLLEEGGKAKIFGAPISAAFNSPASLLEDLDARAVVVRVVAALMVVAMGASTFYTQKQMMARAGTVTDPQQVMVQKIMLYVLPLSFAVSGVFFPIGVLLYWLTTNLWSMGQQAWVIKRMPPVVPGASSSPTKSKGVDLAKGTSAVGSTADAGAGSVAIADAPPRPVAGPSGKAAGSRKNKKKPRGGRR